jgi:phage shock protein PspC (stress-responsive transcriptional regulator)
MDQNDDISSGAGAPTPPPPPPPPGGPTDAPAQQGPRPQDRFFDGIRRSGLHRSQHRVIGGVSGGIAERTGIDVTVVRVLTVVFAIFGGVGILAYGLAWLFLPEPDGRIHAEQVLRGDVSAGAIGGIITTVLSFGGFWSHGPGWGWGGGGFFGWFWGLSGTALFIGVVALVIYAISRSRGQPGSWAGTPGFPPAAPPAAPYAGTQPPPYAGAQPPPSYPTAPLPAYGSGTSTGATMTAPPPTTGPPMATPLPTPAPATPRRPTFGGFGALAVSGLAAIGAGVTALVMSNGTYDASTGTMAWAVALAVISGCLVVGGLVGRRAGVIGLLAILVALGTLISAVTPKMSHVQGVGDRTWQPVSASSAHDGYGLGIGDATLDLTSLDRSTLSAGDPLDIPVSVGFGRLTVLVPADLVTRVRASAGAGDLVRVNTIGLANDGLDRGVFIGDDSNLGDVNGIGVHRTTTVGSGPVQVDITAKVGFGQVQIETVP